MFVWGAVQLVPDLFKNDRNAWLICVFMKTLICEYKCKITICYKILDYCDHNLRCLITSKNNFVLNCSHLKSKLLVHFRVPGRSEDLRFLWVSTSMEFRKWLMQEPDDRAWMINFLNMNSRRWNSQAQQLQWWQVQYVWRKMTRNGRVLRSMFLLSYDLLHV